VSSSCSKYATVAMMAAVLAAPALLAGAPSAPRSAHPGTGVARVAQLSTKNAPAPRAGHSAVWTGSEMIIWGGDDSLESRRPPLATGGQYDPSRDAWRPTGTKNAPRARTGQTAVWTGREMIVWGGQGPDGLLGDGSAYAPELESWKALPDEGAPSPRRGHVALWTGSEMIVWGGQGQNRYLEDGARWVPSQGRWQPLVGAGASLARACVAAVWTGKEMLVWGGEGKSGASATGAAYAPATDHWRPIAKAGAPSARSCPVAAWTGEELLVWGGRGQGQEASIAGGAAYSPSRDRWRRLDDKGEVRRSDLVGVWTGKALLTVGEPEGDDVYPPREGGLLKLETEQWTMFHVGFGWHQAAIVWTGRAALLWGGFDGTNVVDTGVRIVP